MPAKPLTIGSRHFSRQGDAVDFFKDMLGRYPKGSVVTPEDEQDLFALIERHIHYVEKAGVGIACFKVDDDAYSGKCFWVIRKDGTETDFTYRRCITGIWDK